MEAHWCAPRAALRGLQAGPHARTCAQLRTAWRRAHTRAHAPPRHRAAARARAQASGGLYGSNYGSTYGSGLYGAGSTYANRLSPYGGGAYGGGGLYGGSSMYGAGSSLYGGGGGLYGGGGMYGGGYGSSMYGPGGYGGGMGYGGGLYGQPGGLYGQPGGMMGMGMGPGGPFDPANGGPPAPPPTAWQALLAGVNGVMHFFGRLSFLVDENAHAVHFFISALLQVRRVCMRVCVCVLGACAWACSTPASVCVCAESAGSVQPCWK